MRSHHSQRSQNAISGSAIQSCVKSLQDARGSRPGTYSEFCIMIKERTTWWLYSRSDRNVAFEILPKVRVVEQSGMHLMAAEALRAEGPVLMSEGRPILPVPLPPGGADAILVRSASWLGVGSGGWAMAHTRSIGRQRLTLLGQNSRIVIGSAESLLFLALFWICRRCSDY